jgi:hypothetical protein
MKPYRHVAAAGTFVAAFVLVLVAAASPTPASQAALPLETGTPHNNFLPALSRRIITAQPATTRAPTATSRPNPSGTPPIPAGVIVVNHTSVALFDQIPAQYLTAARNLSMLFADRSVGLNIDEGLDCLSVPAASAPASCRQAVHPVPEFSLSPAEVYWPGAYPRPNWTYAAWPGAGDGTIQELTCGLPTDEWYMKLGCFIRYVDANPNAYQVYSYQNSYVEVDNGSDIASLTTGYFVAQPNRMDVTDLEALEARHPNLRFIYWTSSLARAIGTRESTEFNAQMRQYAISHGKVLFDVADIESHTPAGQACYDYRDSVQYCNRPGNCENLADDGQAFPAVCQHYTTELHGGHLGSVSAGKIRIAKAFWVLMARLAGWNP